MCVSVLYGFVCLLNNGHIGDDRFVNCSEVVPSSEIGQCIGRGQQFVH